MREAVASENAANEVVHAVTDDDERYALLPAPRGQCLEAGRERYGIEDRIELGVRAAEQRNLSAHAFGCIDESAEPSRFEPAPGRQREPLEDVIRGIARGDGAIEVTVDSH